MKMGTLIVALVVAGVNIAGIVWLTGGVESTAPPEIDKGPSLEDLPVSESGPWPKAVVPQTEFDFDVMAVNTEKSHKFVLKNEGDTVLKYMLKGTSCSCTASDLERGKTYEIPQGEQADIELTWNPPAESFDFAKYAEIITDDPDNRLITLTIKGRVEQMMRIVPEGGWTLSNLSRTKKQTLDGEIISPILEEFKITSIETSQDNIEASFEPIPKEELEEQYEAKSGYRINVVFDPAELSLGKISEKVTVKTDVEGAAEIPFDITGRYMGPVTALPYRPDGADTSGQQWHPEILGIDLGQFSADAGRKGWYKLVIADMPDGVEFQASDIESSLKHVTAKVSQLSPPQEDRQYLLVEFEVKPGVAPGTYQRKKSAKITMKTNHPKAKDLKFYVEFIAT